MRFIIDAYQFQPSITGTDRMAYNTLTSLQSIDNNNTYYVICSRYSYTRSSVTAKNFKILVPPKLPFQRIANKIWRTILPLCLRLLHADAYYSFHNMRLPRLRVAKRMIASDLDLIPAVFEEYAAIQGTTTKAVLATYRQTLRNADAVIAISKFSKQELIRMLDIDAQKVHVVPLAADPMFTIPPTHSNRAGILTIGGSEPRKNVRTVVDAFLRLPANVQKQHPLLIVGGAWHGRNLDQFNLSPHIHVLGFVSDKELQQLYSTAALLVFASTYEGFGFAVLEAMASSVPVLAADASSLPEVVGNAAILFNPNSSRQLGREMQNLLADNPRREQLIAAGHKQLTHYSWTATAQRMLSILKGSN